ncbi:zinc finger protein 709 isoform X2 [Kryptolebias marmoratus]|uniref:zinc finger protein 709 isoform X2 n=1 Tax=Kryptolebias marmoratus TaxID=37003 RepID=UPI0007F8CFB8|nr:zinc finger protein 709 isoform X2 [Kryptolebias marmoratus]
MDSDVFTAVSKDDFLPLASLRLLVPPFQLLSASMWRVLKERDVMSYWEVAEFVSLVVDAVPELLTCKHRTQLNLGLRARYILELCRSEQPVKPDLILSYLDKMKSPNPILLGESDEEEVKVNFLELVLTLLKDPEEKQDFFKDVFPAEYGSQYDSDLQTLLSEFLRRLARLLPAPDLEQTVSWLAAGSSLLEDCVQTVSEPTDLKNLLQHHRKLGHLELHVPPAGLGDGILSSLSALTSQKAATMTEGPDQSDPPHGIADDTWTVMVVDDDAVEIVAVSDYAEVEVGTSVNANIERCFEGVNASALKRSEEKSEEEATQGPHDCPDCGKKFKFASSLLAHRVIHTGERPHRCSDCGRRFSFRQSLDRHKQTHRTGRLYGCVICGEAFRSPSARTQHKRTHMEDGVYNCRRCDKTFSWEPTFAEHLKSHADDGGSAAAGSSAAEADDEVEGQCPPSEECRSSEPGGLAAKRDKDVRTSGRQRKPTMKVQAINSQKQKKDLTRAKPLPFISSEHSYGSKNGDGNASGEKVQVLQHVHAAGDDLSPQPHAGEGGRYRCADCGKTFRFQSLLKAHRRVHTGEQPFSCAQCGRHFSFKQSLERHRQTHKSGHECLICGELFKSAAEQREHRGAHVQNGKYLCSECGQAFTWKSALARHLRTHGTDADEVKDSLKCPHCDVVFSCVSYLNRHLQTHAEERRHTCNCGKSFAYRAALTAHRRTHQKERPHVCTQCGKGFLYKGGLLSHMKIHSEEMPFMCSFCGKSFKRERNMKKHERCHTREDIFSCSQCDKSFVYKATLTRHELTHSGERPYLCSDCGKGFFSHAELLKHERFHTGHKPFQCPDCGKRFTQSCYLTIHLRYHTGARPYSCTDCDKSFLSANRLKRHQRTHSGEKPYVCAECGKGFRQSYHLKTHQRTHAS